MDECLIVNECKSVRYTVPRADSTETAVSFDSIETSFCGSGPACFHCSHPQRAVRGNCAVIEAHGFRKIQACHKMSFICSGVYFIHFISGGDKDTVFSVTKMYGCDICAEWNAFIFFPVFSDVKFSFQYVDEVQGGCPVIVYRSLCKSVTAFSLHMRISLKVQLKAPCSSCPSFHTFHL